jgi:type I restriction-modification system DNA methylase subunit
MKFKYKNQVNRNSLMDKTVVIERELENEFYKLYNETRLMLIKEFEEINGLSRLESIHYAQMIMNRYMFICFAEDIDLLPPQVSTDTILTPILNGDLRHGSIWQRLNDLFSDIDEGNEYKKISQYNGGIFKENLEHLKIRDIVEDPKFFNDLYQGWKFKEYEQDVNDNLGLYGQKVNPIYRNLLTISTFDFSTELDVNILGHIFENGIGDIEELKQDSKGRRKKDGIFYTPDYITDYICRNTIIPYLSKSGKVNTVDELIEEYPGSKIKELDLKVKEIKIVDPACGSGAFLNKAANVLLEIHESIREQLYTKDTLDHVWDPIEERREILLNNIYGVDLNEESVDITKLSLFLKVCRKGLILPNLEKNIKCGNSLIDDPDFSDKPFKWEKEFKEIFQDGGFDIVIGNPPYVRQERIKEIKPYLKDNYNVYTGVADLYVYFFEKGLKLLKENGKLGFISSNKFIKTNYGKNIREFILENSDFEKYTDHTHDEIFADATTYPSIFILSKGNNSGNKILVNNKFELDQSRLNSDSWGFESPEMLDLRDKIEKKVLK